MTELHQPFSGLIEGRPPADHCEVSLAVDGHRPVPLRYVWHHEQPESAGGATDDVNLIQLCDSCHYSTHRILYAMRLQYEGKPLTEAQQSYLTNPPRKAQLAFAQKGFDLCVAAGTVDKIPNEG
jgi:hypothetical protein